MKFKRLFAFTGLSLAGMHFINKYTEKNAQLFSDKEKAAVYTFSWTYGDVAYSKSGIGSPVLLLHDLAAGSSSYEWNQIISELSLFHTVYTIDLLGCGNSDKPNLTYTNFVYVKLIADFITEVIAAPCTLISSGLASEIAINVPLQKNDLITKLIFINPTQADRFLDITYKERILSTLLQLPVIGTFISNYYNSRKHFEELFYQDYFFDSYKIKNEYVDHYYASYHNGVATSKALFSSILCHYTYTNVPYALTKLTIPLSVILGEAISDYDERIATYQEYSSVDFVSIPSTKLLPHLEAPKETLDALLSFIKD